MTNDDEYLTEHWLFQEKDEFQEFIQIVKRRLSALARGSSLNKNGKGLTIHSKTLSLLILERKIGKDKTDRR